MARITFVFFSLIMACMVLARLVVQSLYQYSPVTVIVKVK